MNRLLIGGAAAALVVAIGPAFAQPAPPLPPGVAQGTAPAPMMAPPPLQRREEVRVQMMGNHVMTRDEVVRHVRDIFARFDTNKDGYVTRQELEAFHSKFADMGATMKRRIEERRVMMHDMAAEMPRRLEEHGMMIGDPSAIFDRLDTNHDGSISRQEFMAAHSNMHRMMIMEHDGGQTMDGEHMKMRMEGDADHMQMPMDGREHEKMEFRFKTRGPMHGMAMGMGGFGAHLFEMADTNHDGRVSLQEAESAALAHFDKADLNHDGKLTPDERRQVHAMMREEHHPS